MTRSFEGVCEQWKAIGFELRIVSGSRYYLALTFPDYVFVVRHTTNTEQLPLLHHSFRVCAKNRDTGQLGTETRIAKGSEELLALTRAWRKQLLEQESSAWAAHLQMAGPRCSRKTNTVEQVHTAI